MPTAKTYQTWETVSEVYSSSGRQYINVRNPKTNAIKTVRWYSEKEASKKTAVTVQDAYHRPTKLVFGFDKGYITIFKGNTYQNLEWFKTSVARYCRTWGWYIVSTEALPEDIPADITPVQLSWDSIGNEDGTLKPDEQIKNVVDSLIYDEGNSSYVGSVGDRLELAVTITRVIALEGNYGTSNMYIMKDADENIFVWTTSTSKNWKEGEIKNIRGTVKAHKKYKNENQNILTRCAEVK